MSAYEFWARPDAMDAWRAQCAAEQAISAATGTTAMERAFGEIDAEAKRLIRGPRNIINQRARRYLASPSGLESIARGLSVAGDRRTLAVLDHLEEQFWSSRPRHVGTGGEVPLINIKGARLRTRYLRRFAERMEAAA